MSVKLASAEESTEEKVDVTKLTEKDVDFDLNTTIEKLNEWIQSSDPNFAEGIECSISAGYWLHRLKTASMKYLSAEAHNTSASKGFYSPPPSFENRIALIHSEVSEALEEFRDGRKMNEMYFREDGKPEGIPSEFADVIIRILDACHFYGIDIEEAVLKKMEFNKSRPHMHGRAHG